VLLKVAHAFLYTLMDFFGRTNCAQAVAILPSSILTFNCTSKTTGWFTKGLKLIPPYANKVLAPHSYIHWWTSFSRTNCAQPLLSYLLPYSVRCTSKTTGWFTKGLKLIPTCTLTKCYSR
jgi:hypothetical protein